MTLAHTNYKAWGLVLSALATAAVAFPTIAETAIDQREAATWQKRAKAITASANFESTSKLSERLADLHTDGTLVSSLSRDAASVAPMAISLKPSLDKATFNAAEYRCLAQAIYYEARSETRAGQKAVAEVVLNRVDSKHFPDSICGVVFEGSERRTGCQFSFTCDGSMEKAPKGKPWDRSQDMARLVLTGGVKPMTNRATHYHTTEVNPVWSNNLRMTRHVGSHVFYRFAPRNYVPSTPMVLAAPPS